MKTIKNANGFDECSHYLKNVVFKGVKLYPHIQGDSQNIKIESVEDVTIENIRYINEKKE